MFVSSGRTLAFYKGEELLWHLSHAGPRLANHSSSTVVHYRGTYPGLGRLKSALQLVQAKQPYEAGALRFAAPAVLAVGYFCGAAESVCTRRLIQHARLHWT